MRTIFKHIIWVGLLFIATNVIAQKNLTTFGMSFKPMIAGSLINEGNSVQEINGVEYSTDKIFGYNAGMVIRHNISKMFALETGLSFTKRNFNLKVDVPADDFSFSQEFAVIGYELPIQALVYVQLSEQIFMDVSFGVVLDMFPSDVAVFSELDTASVIMEGRRKSWLVGALTANIGWEWRTEKAGAFYIGGSYHRSFGDIYGFLMEYDSDPQNINTQPTTINNVVNGNYLTVDLRYFFHASQKEQDQRKKDRKGKRSRGGN